MLPRFPLFAFWPFVSGWMLLWGFAAAVPIIIHLWSKRRYREVTWAAMEFLLAAMKKNSRRIWIEQLLLLAVRVAILLLLALALAEPVLNWFAALRGTNGEDGQTHLVLVLDASYSMDFRSGDKSLFEQAREAAIRQIEQRPQGDGFSLVLLADPPQTIIGRPTFDAAVVIDELRNLRLPHGGADLSATMAEIEAIVKTAVGQHPRLTRHRVQFFTDLGRNTWDDVSAAAVRGRLSKLAQHTSFAVTELGGKSLENAAVVRLAVRESLLTVGRETVLEADVQNFGTHDLSGRRVEFFVDGQNVGERSFDLAAGGRTTVSITHRFESAGEHFASAVLREDALPIDNRRWLSLPVKESVRVLCVQGQADEAKQLALALEPTTSERPRVRVELASENALLESDLQPYDAVWLCNIGRFSHDEAGVLQNYLQSGGGLIFLLGDQVHAENYNSELGGDAMRPRILPARLENLVTDAQYRFDPLDYRHSIVAPFRDQTRAGLLTTPVWRYFRLRPLEPETARVALAFSNGDPAIVEEKRFRGRSILFATAGSTTSLDRSSTPPTPWTALPTWPSFVPLVQETLAVAVSGQSAARNVAVGELMQGVVARTIATSAVTIAGPMTTSGTFGEGERVRLQDEGDDRRWTFANTQFSGVYRAELSAPQSEPFYYAVNVDTQESSLERFDADLLPAQFQAGSVPTETPGGSAAAGGRLPLFRYLLTAVFALLLVESFLAWFFGNRALK